MCVIKYEFFHLFYLVLSRFSLVSTDNFITIPLKKFVDESGARILQEAIASSSINYTLNNKYSLYNSNPVTLAEKFKDVKYDYKNKTFSNPSVFKTRASSSLGYYPIPTTYTSAMHGRTDIGPENQKLQHYGRIEIGTPGQRFDVAFNLVSSLITVPSHKLRKKCGGGFRAFDELSSHTYLGLGETITEGNQTVRVVKDHFHIGKEKITDQTFGLVQEGDCNKETVFDGVIGLGFSANYLSLLDSMVQQRIVNQAIVGLYIDKNMRTVRGGEIAFGNWNSKYIASLNSLQYIPIVESVFPAWQIQVNYSLMGGRKVTVDRHAVIDTNAYFLGIPWYEAEIIADVIGAYNFRGNLIVSCNNVSKLPELKIYIQEKEFILTGSDYIDTVKSYKGHCNVLIRPTKDNVWTLGGSFIGKYYTVFNYETKKVAFAELKPATGNG